MTTRERGTGQHNDVTPWECHCIECDDPFEDERECTVCGGEGYVDCDDPIQCTRRHIGDRWLGDCECSACGGSGLAKDQTSW